MSAWYFQFIGAPIGIAMGLVMTGCDGSDGVPVTHVDSGDLVSETELARLSSARKPRLRNTFYFGFDLRGSPEEDTAQYLPFLQYLESNTGLDFKLHFTPQNSSTVEELGLDHTQFAAMGADGFLKAQSWYDAKILVRGVNQQGRAEYQSVFVVSRGSEIRNLDGIKGRSLAFGDVNSTQGHLIPRIVLSENGIDLDDLKSFDYAGSHQRCAEAVVSGRFDVCAMQDQLAKKIVDEGALRIIYFSRFYPSSGVVVNNTVNPEVVEKVRRALLDFDPQGKHKRGLYHWDDTEMAMGFVAAQSGDYENLREWSIALGFLDPQGVSYKDR